MVLAKPYLISAQTLMLAKRHADRLGLEDQDWIYLPYHDEKERAKRLKHLSYTPKEAREKLQGIFTTKEYNLLIKKTEK
ncbi:hypothetical protein [Melghirimyces algeriensis]|uniref:Uncharacterized protein n=1 Tax=Melghirimyces algeriensis TaxID=910412 RepID=A0A521CBY9_9BACL|nr:hypothetical protein [Melghirimyces algeriensis]SMO56936.1 hypothetical protein SAMN06264849_103252 [Melghirimyces algeriensis]